MLQQGKDHLRRGVHIVGVSQVVLLDPRDLAPIPGPDTADEIDLNHDLLTGSVSGFPLAVAAVEMPEELIPCGGTFFLAGINLIQQFRVRQRTQVASALW